MPEDGELAFYSHSRFRLSASIEQTWHETEDGIAHRDGNDGEVSSIVTAPV